MLFDANNNLKICDFGLCNMMQDGSSLTIWQERGHMHVFTGDTLARDRRRSIALEPVETPTNAFNQPRLAAALTLQPGETRNFRFGFRFEAAR